MASINPENIYKIVGKPLWDAAQQLDYVPPMEIDVSDGFMHFSTRAQLDETLKLHFSGQKELMILCVRAHDVSLDLKWEPSRGGDLFPHLYAQLPKQAIVRVQQIDVAADGTHNFQDIPI